MSPLQYLSKTFTCLSKVTLPNFRENLVKVTLPSPLQCLDGSLYKFLRSLKVYFHAVYYELILTYLKLKKDVNYLWFGQKDECTSGELNSEVLKNKFFSPNLYDT